MNYNTDNQLDMTFDEYTYNVDMMLMADFGEPATLEQLRHIGIAWEQGLSPSEAYAAIAELHNDSDYDAEWDIFDDLAVAA